MPFSLFAILALLLDGGNRILSLAANVWQLAALHASRMRPVHHVKHAAKTAHAAAHAKAKARYTRRHDSPVSADVAERLSLSDHIAIGISDALGTMPTAGAFAALSLVSLPAAILSHDPVVIVSWISQTFIQLVALSILGIAARLGNRQSEAHTAAMFAAQNRVMDQMLAALTALRAQDRTHDAQIAELQDQQDAQEAQEPPVARKTRRPRHADVQEAS